MRRPIMVSVPRTFLYPGPDLRFPVSGATVDGVGVTVTGATETRGTHYALLPSGEAIIAGHLRPVAEASTDYVSVAETFLGTPYLWGGASGFGIDCSGLVQLAMRMAGRQVLRDSDMQAATIGEPLDPGPDFAGLRRGDLVFWKGHVAIMTDAETMIHANGHTMLVSREGLKDADRPHRLSLRRPDRVSAAVDYDHLLFRILLAIACRSRYLWRVTEQPRLAEQNATVVLPEPFIRWFAEKGWSPRAHQIELLAKAQAGQSVLLIAPTGAGKTLAGFLPSLTELADRPKRKLGRRIAASTRSTFRR